MRTGSAFGVAVLAVLATAVRADMPVFHCMGQAHAEAEWLGSYNYVRLESGLIHYEATAYSAPGAESEDILGLVEIVENCATRERVVRSEPFDAEARPTDDYFRAFDILIAAQPDMLEATAEALRAEGWSAAVMTVDWESCACAIERDPANLPLPDMQPPGVLQVGTE